MKLCTITRALQVVQRLNMNVFYHRLDKAIDKTTCEFPTYVAFNKAVFEFSLELKALKVISESTVSEKCFNDVSKDVQTNRDSRL